MIKIIICERDGEENIAGVVGLLDRLKKQRPELKVEVYDGTWLDDGRFPSPTVITRPPVPGKVEFGLEAVMRLLEELEHETTT